MGVRKLHQGTASCKGTLVSSEHGTVTCISFGVEMTGEYRHTFLSIIFPFPHMTLQRHQWASQSNNQLHLHQETKWSNCHLCARFAFVPGKHLLCSQAVLLLRADCCPLLRSPLAVLLQRDPRATQHWCNKLWTGISFARAVFFWMKTVPVLTAIVYTASSLQLSGIVQFCLDSVLPAFSSEFLQQTVSAQRNPSGRDHVLLSGKGLFISMRRTDWK